MRAPSPAARSWRRRTTPSSGRVMERVSHQPMAAKGSVTASARAKEGHLQPPVLAGRLSTRRCALPSHWIAATRPSVDFRRRAIDAGHRRVSTRCGLLRVRAVVARLERRPVLVTQLAVARGETSPGPRAVASRTREHDLQGGEHRALDLGFGLGERRAVLLEGLPGRARVAACSSTPGPGSWNRPAPAGAWSTAIPAHERVLCRASVAKRRLGTRTLTYPRMPAAPRDDQGERERQSLAADAHSGRASSCVIPQPSARVWPSRAAASPPSTRSMSSSTTSLSPPSPSR